VINADSSLLQAALIGLESQRTKLEATIAEIRAELSQHGSHAPASATEVPKKRTMSASTKRRMARAQKRRWVAFHKENTEPASSPGRSVR